MIEQLFRETLQKHNFFHTPERIRIFQVLKDLKTPCTVSEIVDMTSSSVDRSTVYRNLDLFEKIGIINRVYTGWKYKLELSDQFSPHHHHMTCTGCAKVIKFQESKALIEELRKIEVRDGFQSTSHTLELAGLCRNCS